MASVSEAWNSSQPADLPERAYKVNPQANNWILTWLLLSPSNRSTLQEADLINAFDSPCTNGQTHTHIRAQALLSSYKDADADSYKRVFVYIRANTVSHITTYWQIKRRIKQGDNDADTHTIYSTVTPTYTHTLSGKEEHTVVCQWVVKAVSKAISQSRDCWENEITPGTAHQLVTHTPTDAFLHSSTVHLSSQSMLWPHLPNLDTIRTCLLVVSVFKVS